MPYTTVQELRPSVRNALPLNAQEVFRKAFNVSWGKYDEATCFKIAWSAVKKAGYRKTVTGKWKKY